MDQPLDPRPPAGCHACLSRRQFLAHSAVVTAAAAFAAACGNGQIGPTGVKQSNNGGPVTITVGDFPALANTGTLVAVGNFIAVKRTGTASFAAYSMICTHQGCLTELQSNAFFCPCHGSEFDGSGRVVRGPASRALPQYATSYDPATDTLTIG